VSDQNQWPKPGETTPEGGASTNHPERGAQPNADRSADGQPQQYGASAPEAPASASAPADPWGQSGQGASAQGVSGGSAAPQNPYAAPGQQYGQQNAQQPGPYGQQNAQYGRPSGQPGYGAPQNPYAAPGQQYGQQYGQPGYGAQQNPYAPAGQQNPYASAGQQNPYAPAGYQPYAQRPKTNTLAILSIVFAFGGVIIWPLVILTSPAGAIMGHIALGKIKQSGEGGRGLALAGVIGGWILTGLFILVVVLVIVFASMGSSYSDYNYDYDSGAFIG
jgi:hypothetical protein